MFSGKVVKPWPAHLTVRGSRPKSQRQLAGQAPAPPAFGSTRTDHHHQLHQQQRLRNFMTTTSRGSQLSQP